MALADVGAHGVAEVGVRGSELPQYPGDVGTSGLLVLCREVDQGDVVIGRRDDVVCAEQELLGAHGLEVAAPEAVEIEAGAAHGETHRCVVECVGEGRRVQRLVRAESQPQRGGAGGQRQCLTVHARRGAAGEA